MQKDNTLSTAEITLGNNKSVTAFVIEQDIDRPLAIVDFAVLKRLASLLPTASFDKIKSEFLRNTRDNVHNIEDFTKCLSEELAFHTSVNVIQTCSLTNTDSPQEQSTLNY